MPDSRRRRGKSPVNDRISKRDGDFEEADVWGFVKKMDSSSCTSRKLKDSNHSPTSSSTGSSSLRTQANKTSPSSGPKMVRQSSAPVDIPDWSKIYGKNSNKFGDKEGDRHGGEEKEDDDGEMVPPHEWIAKKFPSSSVCEGAGRTLKGRDLINFRNSVLKKTGFIE